MSKEKQIEEMVCKNCIHYQMCVNTFRKGKQDGEYLLIEEDEYFAHANGCDFYADKRICRKQSGVAREIFAEIERVGVIRKIIKDGEIVFDVTAEYDELKEKYIGDRS